MGVVIKKVIVFGASGNTGKATVEACMKADISHVISLFTFCIPSKMVVLKSFAHLNKYFLRKNLVNIHLKDVRTLCTSNNPELVVFEKLDGEHKGVINLGMNKPDTKNALSKKMLMSFREALESIRYDANARVLIIHSLVNNIFCAGADLKERALMPEPEVGPFVASLRRLLIDLKEFPLPTIAAIDGFALGGGLEMALACDMRVASSVAKMGLVETKLAIIPGGGGTQLLPRLVGPAIAKELIFTGRILDGLQGSHIGLVNYAVDQNAEGNAAFLKSLELAKEIASQGPIAVKLAKLAIDKGLEVDLNSGFAFEQFCYAQTIGTKDRVEGLRAFKEKRPPKYTAE